MDPSRYYVLVEFAVRHLDFLAAELASVLRLHDITYGSPDCRVETLPQLGPHPTNSTAIENCSHVDHKNTVQDQQRRNEKRQRPFCILSFPFDAPCVPRLEMLADKVDSAKNLATSSKSQTSSETIGNIILSRCVLVRSVMELWGYGPSLDDCVEQVRQWTDVSSGSTTASTLTTTNCQHSYQKLVRDHGRSWKLTVHTLGCTYSREVQEAMRSRFQFLALPGPVQMNDPTDEYVLIRETELDDHGSPLPGGSIDSAASGTNPPRTRYKPNDSVSCCYFGRALGGTRQTKHRGDVSRFSLKSRAYLGPTSMDAELSFVMANLAGVGQSSVVLDPFVGTGSILVSCAARGAYCVGTDIDIRVLRGKGENSNVVSNFRQFDLPRPELIRSDNAIYQRHFRRTHIPMYNAIVTDPPYGIRAGARKSGSRLDQPRPVLESNRHNHIAQTKPYVVSDVMVDLLDVAARTLVLGGRLVYVIPSFRDFEPESDLPRHECLKTVHICYQPLSAELGRRVVVMQKQSEYDPTQRKTYLAKSWKNGAKSAERCANIRDKIMEAAKLKPNYQERAAVRKQKRKIHKEEKKRVKLEKVEMS